MRFQCREWTKEDEDEGPSTKDVEGPYGGDDSPCGEFEPWPGHDEHERLRQPKAQRSEEANLQEAKQKLLLKKVDDRNLSVRATNRLKEIGVTYIGELIQKTRDDLLITPSTGFKALREIEEVLRQMGLCLGIKLPDWAPPVEATCIILPGTAESTKYERRS